MKNCCIDCTGISTRQALHQALQEAMSLPEWYGRNLDALYDCLTDLPEECCLTVRNFQALAENLGVYADSTRSVLEEAARDNPFFFVVFAE